MKPNVPSQWNVESNPASCAIMPRIEAAHASPPTAPTTIGIACPLVVAAMTAPFAGGMPPHALMQRDHGDVLSGRTLRCGRIASAETDPFAGGRGPGGCGPISVAMRAPRG